MWNDGNNHTILRFNNNDSIAFYDYSRSSISGELVTNALYRDTSAWYHIVAQFDSTQATAGDRMKLYVNGERITSFTGTGSISFTKFHYLLLTQVEAQVMLVVEEMVLIMMMD